MTAERTSGTVSARLHYLDNLRTFAVMLVILHHTAITYGASGSWYYHEVGNASLTSILLTLYCAVNQAFFMGLLFFISGYFSPISLDRKGTIRFIRDKLVRLGIPLLFYAFVLGPALAYSLYYSDTQSFGGYYSSRILSFREIGFGPLWFVEALLIFNLAYILWRTVFRHTRIWRFPSIRALLAIALLTGVVAFSIRLFCPTGMNVLQMQLGYFASYVALFVAGIVAYRSGWLEAIPQKTVRVWSLIAAAMIVILPVFVVLGGALSGDVSRFQGGLSWQAVTYALWEPFVAFGIILFLLTWFRRHLDRAGTLLRALSESSYTAYIIHPPVIVGISMLVKDVTAPAAVKFVSVGAAGIAVCFTLSRLIITIPGIRRVL